MSTSQAVGIHICPTCGKVFTWSNNLLRHIRTVHGSQQLHSCPICSRLYKRKDILQHHIRSDHKLPNISLIPLPTVSGALAFTNAPQVSPKYSKAATTTQAQSTAASNNSMSSSIESNQQAPSGDDQHVTKETSVSSGETSNGKCDKQKCSTSFSVVMGENDPGGTTGSLSMEVEEINTEASKTNSEQTAAAYTMSSTGQTHVTSVMDTRTNIRPLSDQIYSNESCSTNQARDSHLCPTCGEVFTRFNNLLRHNRTMHNSQQQHSCPICNRLYKRTDYLKRHIKIDHKLPNISLIPPTTVSGALAFTNAPQVSPKYSKAATTSQAQSTAASKNSMSSSIESNQQAPSGDDSDNDQDVTKETSASSGETSNGKCDKQKNRSSLTVVMDENDPYGTTGSLSMEVEAINTEASKTNGKQTAATYTMSPTGQTHVTSIMSTGTSIQPLSDQTYSNRSCSTSQTTDSNMCLTCGKVFTWYNNLLRHNRTMHGSQQLHSCLICSRLYKRKGDLTHHIKSDHELPNINLTPLPNVNATLAFTNAPQVPPNYSKPAATSQAQSPAARNSSMSSSAVSNQQAPSREQACVFGPAFSLAEGHEIGHKLHNVSVPQTTSNDSHQFAPVISNIQTLSPDDFSTNSIHVSGPQTVSTQEPQICIGSEFDLADSHTENHTGHHETENEVSHIAVDNCTGPQTLLECPILPHDYQQNKTEKECGTVSSQLHTTLSTEQNQYSALCSPLKSPVCLTLPMGSSNIQETNILLRSITSSKNSVSVEVSSPKDDSELLLGCSASKTTSAAHQQPTSAVTCDAQLPVSRENGSIAEGENKTTDVLRGEETHEKPASLTKPQDSSSTSQMLPSACKVQEPEIKNLHIQDIDDFKLGKVALDRHHFSYGSNIPNSEVMVDDSDNVEDVIVLTKETRISPRETSGGKCDKQKSSAGSTVFMDENDSYGTTGSLSMEVEEINTEASTTNSRQTAATYTMSSTGQTHVTSVMDTRTNTQPLSDQIYLNGSCSTWYSSEIENSESELMDLHLDDDDDECDDAPLSNVEYTSLKVLTPSQPDTNVSSPFTQSMFSSSSLLSSTSDIPVLRESFRSSPDIQVQVIANTLRRKIKIPSTARTQEESPSCSEFNFKTVELTQASTETDSSVMCKLCFMFFSSRMELVTHTWNQHRSSQFVENNLKCDGCGKCFANNSLLKLHKKVKCTSSNITDVCPGPTQVSLDSILHTLIKQNRVNGAPEVPSSSATFKEHVEPQASTARLSSNSAAVDISNSTHVDVSNVLNSFPQRSEVISNYSTGAVTEAATDKRPNFSSFQHLLYQKVSEGCKVSRNDCVSCFVCAKTFTSSIKRYLHVLKNPKCKQNVDRYCKRCSHLFNSPAHKQDHLHMFKSCRIYEECVMKELMKDPFAKNVGNVEKNVKERGNQLRPVFTASEISQPGKIYSLAQENIRTQVTNSSVPNSVSYQASLPGSDVIQQFSQTNPAGKSHRKKPKGGEVIKQKPYFKAKPSTACPVCKKKFATSAVLILHCNESPKCRTKICSMSPVAKHISASEVAHMTSASEVTQMTSASEVAQMTSASEVAHMTSASEVTQMTSASEVAEMTSASEVTQITSASEVTQMTSASEVAEKHVCDQGNENDESKGDADGSDKDELLSSMSASDEGSDMEESGSSSEEGNTDYTCKQCCKTYASKSLLIKHNKSHHQSAHSKRTHCKVCTRKFHDLTGLQAHLLQFKFCFIPLTRPLWEQKHDTQICSMCKKVLGSSKDLRKHCFKKMACRLRYVNMVLKNMKEKDHVGVVPAAEAEIPVLKTGKENCESESTNVVSSSVQDYCSPVHLSSSNVIIEDGISCTKIARIVLKPLIKCLNCREFYDDFQEHLLKKQSCLDFFGIHANKCPGPLSFCYQCKTHFNDVGSLQLHACKGFVDYTHVCQTCGLKFTSAHNLHAHYQQSLQCNKTNLSSPQKNNRDSRCTFVESSAKNQQSGMFALSSAARDVPSSSGEQFSHCLICDARFGTLRLLMEHSYQHVEETPISCDRCSITFVHYNQFVSHQAFHIRMDKEANILVERPQL